MGKKLLTMNRLNYCADRQIVNVIFPQAVRRFFKLFGLKISCIYPFCIVCYGDGTWIGCGMTILLGVVIGQICVVCARALVTCNL